LFQKKEKTIYKYINNSKQTEKKKKAGQYTLLDLSSYK